MSSIASAVKVDPRVTELQEAFRTLHTYSVGGAINLREKDVARAANKLADNYETALKIGHDLPGIAERAYFYAKMYDGPELGAVKRFYRVATNSRYPEKIMQVPDAELAGFAEKAIASLKEVGGKVGRVFDSLLYRLESCTDAPRTEVLDLFKKYSRHAVWPVRDALLNFESPQAQVAGLIAYERLGYKGLLIGREAKYAYEAVGPKTDQK